MSLTKLSLGCSAFGGVFVHMPDDDCLAILRKAFAEGLTLLDTAPWYKTSEQVVGRCLRRLSDEIPRESYRLNTKCGRYPQGKMFDFSASRIVASVEQSLTHLQTSYIDTIQVHDCEFADEDVIVNETLPALDTLRREGKVRKIGITGYDLTVLRRILERTDVKVDSVLSYCRYTLNDRTLLEGEGDTDFVSYLESQGIELINASAIAMGLLCKNAPPAWHPASDALKKRCVEASKYAEENGCDLARLALGFVLRNPRIPTTLVSVTTMAQMDSNLSVMRDGLSAKETEVLEEILGRFFPTSEHWEGVELARMKSKAERKAAEAQLLLKEKLAAAADSKVDVADAEKEAVEFEGKGDGMATRH